MQIKAQAQPHTSADPAVAAIIQVVSPVVDAAGLYLEKIAVTGPKHQRVVTLSLDLPDGDADLGSAQLEEVSRAIGAALDASDPVPGAYTLEISTLGAEHELTNLRLARRALGKDVEVRIGGQVRTGILTDVTETGLSVNDDGDVTVYPFEDIESVRTVILFGKPRGSQHKGRKNK
ncbi:ribosome maturation factor RimP [uncultured Mobiluncus sp.]|uniref:ribosome maturation factor RimP n=1 Tax=uncultured Mobiluncus sp. TaxID=293425 RepID=UPI002603702C|nr:ribosome assembly cofactor RimP [uncultured Mobiluncus sp.]